MVGVCRAPGGSWDRQGVSGLSVPVTLDGRRLTTLQAPTPAKRRKLDAQIRTAQQDNLSFGQTCRCAERTSSPGQAPDGSSQINTCQTHN
jgi:hypothetical protein